MSACTIMVIVNREKVYEEFEEGLKRQKGIRYQLIRINNMSNEYSGARQAYQAHLSEAAYELILFMHPDIRFLDDQALQGLVEQVEKIDSYGVIGVAGCKEDEAWQIYSSMLHGRTKLPCGKMIKDKLEVQCVDECLFAMQREKIIETGFSEIKGWHLYAVEQCLYARQSGLKNYVVPCTVWHLSDGRSLDPSYIIILRQLRNLILADGGILNTTVRRWDMKSLRGRVFIDMYFWKQCVKKVLQKCLGKR